MLAHIGTPSVPFLPLHFGVSLFKLNKRKKGTLTMKRLLLNLGETSTDGPSKFGTFLFRMPLGKSP